MPFGPPFTRLLEGLPACVPFVAPEALVRRSGKPLRLRLGANESAFGPSRCAVEAMRSAVERVAHYGDPESAALCSKLANVHGVSPENVVVCSGIDDLIGLAIRAFVEPGGVAVTSLGSYPTFDYHVHGFGGVLSGVPYRNDSNDLDGLAETTRRSGARVVYLANPDNPSGTWHSASAVQAFIDRLPRETLLLLDEAYIEYAPPGTSPPIDVSDPRVLRMRTFSKAHGLAGARIGYGLCASAMVSAFDKIRHHFGVNALAQAGALASLSDDEHVAHVVDAVAEGRREYYELARSLRLSAISSAANFVAIDVGGPSRARALVASLEERSVFVRMPRSAPLDRCIRVSVGTPEERVEFASIFRDVCGR